MGLYSADYVVCCCRAYDATDAYVASPTYNCTYAWGSRAYSNYTGADAGRRTILRLGSVLRAWVVMTALAAA
jgi:hypothetical protein